ncbi:hypothetical protein ACWOD8_07415 [Enterococcus plantarum]|uniref:hypothetical protein n=1 Tax=Enterococcus plantarum TaxID=1077675 RepID=UPI001428D0D5|nr:hypothetical protein [Enterococcus plantarum]
MIWWKQLVVIAQFLMHLREKIFSALNTLNSDILVTADEQSIVSGNDVAKNAIKDM